jgi:hypothetical protein
MNSRPAFSPRHRPDETARASLVKKLGKARYASAGGGTDRALNTQAEPRFAGAAESLIWYPSIFLPRRSGDG